MGVASLLEELAALEAALLREDEARLLAEELATLDDMLEALAEDAPAELAEEEAALTSSLPPPHAPRTPTPASKSMAASCLLILLFTPISCSPR